MLYENILFSVPDSIFPASIGMCLPSICLPQTILDSINSVLEAVNSTAEAVAVIPVNTDYYYPNNWGLYALAAILTVVILLNLTGTLIKKSGTLQKSFNMVTNTRELTVKAKAGTIESLSGLKALMMLWVVLGHQFSFALTGVVNLPTIDRTTSTIPYLLIDGGLLSIDVFFMIGGFLTAYNFLKATKSNLGTKALPIAILDRALRFWPSYTIAILFYYSVFLKTGSGPRWAGDPSDVLNCSQIWRPLLFIDNLVNDGSTMCMGWGWYIQNDMQIFIFSLGLLVLYRSRKTVCYIAIVITMLAALTDTYLRTYKNGYRFTAHLVDFTNWAEYFLTVYIKPWSRSPPYLLGFSLGMVYSSHRKANPIQDGQGSSKLAGWQGTILQGTGLAMSLLVLGLPRSMQVYGTQSWSQFAMSMYLALGKVVFTGGLALMLLPIVMAPTRQCLLHKFLTTPTLLFLSRISFWIYLIHLFFIFHWYNSIKNDVYYSWLNCFILFVAHISMTVVVATLMTILVEIPFGKAQKIFFAKLTH